MNRGLSALIAAAFAAAAVPAHAADDAELKALQAEIAALRHDYEGRLSALEARLQRAEAQASAAPAAAPTAPAAAEPAPAPVAAAGGGAGSNAFNPDISLILSGTYASLSRDPETFRFTGFIPGGEIGPGKRGFSLGESELGIYANIDPWFWGGINVALSPDNETSVEEAFVQTTSLPGGLTVKAGRFFSGIGYLNPQHAHTWDFVDAPLAYQAFLGTQLGDDGVQLKWVAPTDTFVELGGELGRGRNFPGSDRDRNAPGAQALYAHVGGDVGVSQSWRAGLSWLRTTPRGREFEDFSDAALTDAFSGTSRLWLADFVWKWAPNGDATRTNFKLQGEYFRRREDGTLTVDLDSPVRAAYASNQSGWYLQGVYQFMPAWRVGARYDRLDAGRVDSPLVADTGYDPSRVSLMLDWSPSEFSRWRLQASRDKSRQGEPDNELFVQYLMSLGAHGAHTF